MTIEKADFIIEAVVAFPAKVVEGQTINNIVYSVKNISDATKTVTFNKLDGQGVTHTANFTTLNAGASGQLAITFVAPQLPSGVDELPYIHYFEVIGGSRPVPFYLNTKIVAGSTPAITAKANITFDTTATTSSTFTVTLKDLTTSTTRTFNNVPFGESVLADDIVPDQYEITVTPSTVTGSDSNDYLAPQKFNQYLSVDGVVINLPYKKNSTIAVSTNITAPNLSGTVEVSMIGANFNYTHDQASGTHSFDNMEAGSYTLSADDYTGTDSKVYRAILNNPYSILVSPLTIPIVYEERPPQPTKADWTVDRVQSGELMENIPNLKSINYGGGVTTGIIQYGPDGLPANSFALAKVNAYQDNPVDSPKPLAGYPNKLVMGAFGKNTDATFTNMTGQNGIREFQNYVYGGNVQDYYWEDDPTHQLKPEIERTSSPTDLLTRVSALGRDVAVDCIMYTLASSVSPDALRAYLKRDKMAIQMYNAFYLMQTMQLRKDGGYTGSLGIKFNPDMDVFYNTAGEWYNPRQFRKGLCDPAVTTDVVYCGDSADDLRGALSDAIDNMIKYGYLTSENKTTILAQFDSEGIATPPSTTVRDRAGVPEFLLAINFMKQFLCPDVTLGLGLNIYDANNKYLMADGQDPDKWMTGSYTWIHYLRKAAESQTAKTTKQYILDGIAREIANQVQFLQYDTLGIGVMGKLVSGARKYAYDFVYFDRFERDDFAESDKTTYQQGFANNQIDLDIYHKYIGGVTAALGIPVKLFQIPGSSFKIGSENLDGNTNVSSFIDYHFGHPGLQNDLSNLRSELNLNDTTYPFDATVQPIYQTDATGPVSYLTKASPLQS